MEIEPYVIDVLLPDLVGHDRRPSAYLTYLYLYRHRAEGGSTHTLRELSEGTGLSKRSVQGALAILEARGLIEIAHETITSPGHYTVLTPWRRGG